ncbi:hypothetical protein SMAC4_13759 [Sordaria macrospora]|uniref:uncharacterized protein n=1 Tax=Sordaria macrospora TaxID=5147 RepID=UPI001DE46BCD|nr:hypothetical protein B0T09DRAFT_25818 [Sordaria sp. MPI-SDFR-AT-0083]WPJ64156.1 hypothetical protein SMAC4_13759 [Sordaria macrospora]
MFVCGHKVADAEHVIAAQDLAMYAHGFYNTEDDHPALPQIQRAMDDWASSWERQREMAIHIDCKPHIFESRAWTPPRAPIPSTLAERLYVNNKTHLTATYYLDRIYGLLGISSDSHALGIVPEYSSTASISVRLTQVARSMILRGGYSCSSPTPEGLPSLSILRCAQFPKICPEYMEKNGSKPIPLPTWVPDWRGHLVRSCGDDHYLYQENMHSPAGKFSKVEILSTSSSAILGLRGFYIDAIEEVGDTQYIAHTEDISNVNVIMEVVQMHLDLFSSIKRLWSTSLSKSSKAYHTCFRQVEPSGVRLWEIS